MELILLAVAIAAPQKPHFDATSERRWCKILHQHSFKHKRILLVGNCWRSPEQIVYQMSYHPENALIVQSDRTIFLEVYSPKAEAAREAIV